MILDEIDAMAFWEDDARDDPDPSDKPYFSRLTICGKLNYEGWSELECLLDERGLRIEDMVSQ